MAIVDFHNHLMPGVDDGAQTAADSASALVAFRAEGVTRVVATPHVDASLGDQPEAFQARMEALDAACALLQQAAAGSGVEVLRGAELALDVPVPDITEPRLRLAGTDFVLVEFAYMSVPPNSASVLERIRSAGWIPVLAHPERYGALTHNPDLAVEWRRAGACLQLNGASLLGRYGAEARQSAEMLLARGLADYVCSDYHTRTGPWVARYVQWLTEHGGGEHALLLTEMNPQRLLEGEMPIPVPPLIHQRNLWQRVRSMFG
jgi:protein-tyrosine phosphatase